MPNSLFQPSHVRVYLEIRKDSSVGEDATHTPDLWAMPKPEELLLPVPASASSQSIFHHLTSNIMILQLRFEGEPQERPEKGGTRALGCW